MELICGIKKENAGRAALHLCTRAVGQAVPVVGKLQTFHERTHNGETYTVLMAADIEQLCYMSKEEKTE